MVALTTLQGLLDLRALVRISLMPAASTTARTGPPAITPVPGAAGLSSTLPAPYSADDLVRDRRAPERDLDKVFLGVLDPFADSVGHLAGFAYAEANLAFAVAHDHERRELEYAPAFYGLGYTVDGHDFLGHFRC
jgi:hypothetical protein